MSSIDGLMKINSNYKTAEEQFLLYRTKYLEESINVVNTYYSNIEILEDSNNFKQANVREFIRNLKDASNILKRLGIIEDSIDYCNKKTRKKLTHKK